MRYNIFKYGIIEIMFGFLFLSLPFLVLSQNEKGNLRLKCELIFCLENKYKVLQNGSIERDSCVTLTMFNCKDNQNILGTELPGLQLRNNTRRRISDPDIEPTPETFARLVDVFAKSHMIKIDFKDKVAIFSIYRVENNHKKNIPNNLVVYERTLSQLKNNIYQSKENSSPSLTNAEAKEYISQKEIRKLDKKVSNYLFNPFSILIVKN